MLEKAAGVRHTVARLDTMVTVVDAFTFFDRLAEIERVRDQNDAEGDEDERRTLCELMVDQVTESLMKCPNRPGC